MDTLTLKYVETIELPSKVLGNYSFEISENGYISIATTTALYIYQICSLKDNKSPSLYIKKYSVLPSNFILCANVGLDINTFLQELPQNNFYEAVMSTDFSAKLDNGSSLERKIIKSSWSPKIIDDYDCALAVLSNTGSLEITTKIYNTTYEEFKSIYNLTQKYTEMCCDTWKSNLGMTALEKYNELKYRIRETLPTAFTWSSKIDDYCVLIVGHACGDISFWKVNAIREKHLQESDITFINVVNGNLRDMNLMYWIPTINNNGLLLVGNCEGRLSALKIPTINKEQIILNGEIQLWKENDDILVKEIKVLTYLHNHYFVFAKGSDLIFFLFDEKGEHVDSCIFHVGNMLITGLQVIEENRLLVACLSGAVKELVVSCTISKLNIEWKHFYVNINWYIYQLLNFLPSVNRMLFFFLTGPCKIADTKEDKDLNQIYVFINTAKNSLDMLSNNPSSSFKGYWDCLEAFRCQSLIDKQLSLNGIKFEKHYDNFSLYQLKLQLWISKVSESIYEQTGNVNLSIKSYEDIYEILNIKMAIYRMLYLLKLYEEKKDITEFQLHNIFLLNCYLKQIIAEDLVVKFEFSENIVTLLLDIILRANIVKYSSFPDCLHCGEKLIGISCLPPHFDMRCSISLMQIGKYPDYKCAQCGRIAHNEIKKEFDEVICPFCDVSMLMRQKL